MATFQEIVDRKAKDEIVPPGATDLTPGIPTPEPGVSRTFKQITAGKKTIEADRQIPELRAYEPSVWEELGNLFTDSDKAGADAVLAIVDAEMQNMGKGPDEPVVTPSMAMRLRKEIDKGVKLNPARAKLRGDLSTIVKQNLQTGYSQVNLGLWGSEALLGNESPDVLRAIEETKASMPLEEEKPYPETLLQEFGGSAAEMFPFLAESAKRGAWRGAILGGGTWLLGSATGTQAITYPLIPAMYAVGQTSASLEFVGKVEAGLAYVEMIGFEDPVTGEKINPNVARAAAYGVGAINGMIEFAQLKTLVQSFPGGKKLLRGLINDTVSEVVESRALHDILGRTISNFGTLVAKETTQELAQESTNITFDIFARNLTNYLDGTDLSNPEKEEIIERLVQTGIQSAQAFAVLGAPGPVVSGALDIKGARESIAEERARQERLGKVFKATAFQQLKDAEGAELEARFDVSPEEVQRFIDDPAQSSITDEMLDAVLGAVGTEEEASLNEFVRQAGFEVPEIEVDVEPEVPAQIGEPVPDPTVNPNFVEWSGGASYVPQPEIQNIQPGQPVVVRGFHGTTHDFDVIDPSLGNAENDLGKGFYVTSNEDDVLQNYVGEGPDLTQRIEQRKEQLTWEVQEAIDNDELAEFAGGFGVEVPADSEGDAEVVAAEIARVELVGTVGEGQALDLFVKIDNPFVVDKQFPEQNTFVDFQGKRDQDTVDEQKDEAWDEIKADNDLEESDRPDWENEIQERAEELFDEAGFELEDENSIIVLDKMNEVAFDNSTGIENLGISQELQDMLSDEVSASDFIDAAKNFFAYAEDEEGKLNGNQIVGELIQELGFDGVVYNDASQHFPNMNIAPGTKHFIVWEPTSVKSVENRGEFSRTDPDIAAQVGPARLKNLPVFDAARVTHVGVRQAAEAGLISEDDAAVIDGIMQVFPEAWAPYFEARFSEQQFRPTEAQLLAHGVDIPTSQDGQVVLGALLTEDLQGLKDESKSIAVMFRGSDVTTFLHEFGEFAFKRLLTKEEKKYVGGVANRKAKGKAANEFFSDEFRNFVVRNVEGKDPIFPPKLTELFQKVAQSIQDVWRRLRSIQETPALDELFVDIITGGRDIQKISDKDFEEVATEDLEAVYGDTYRQQLLEAVNRNDIADYSDIAADGARLAEQRTSAFFKNVEAKAQKYAKRRALELVNADPVYSAMDEAIKVGGLNIEQLRADYGKEAIETLRRKRIGILTKNGVAPDEFAADHDFDSLDEMIEKMIAAPTKKDATKKYEFAIEEEELRFQGALIRDEWDNRFALEETKAISELLIKRKPKIRKDLKKIIRQQTGQVRDDQITISESAALRELLKREAQAARVAFRAGNTEGVETGKARIRAIVERAKESQSLRTEANKLRKQAKRALKQTKIKKKGGKPVGRFGAERQVILDKLRSAMGLTQAQASIRLNQSLKDFEDEIPPADVALENMVLSMQSKSLTDITAQDIDLWKRTVENIKAFKSAGIAELEERATARREELSFVRQEVIDLVGGIPKGVKTVGEEAVADKTVIAGIKRTLLAGGFINKIVGWKDLLDILSFKDKTSAPGQSVISKFGDVLDQKNTEKQGNLDSMEQIRAMVFDIYGFTSDHEMIKLFREDAKLVSLGEFENVNGEIVELKLTKAQARKRAMEILDPTLHDTLFSTEGMAWSQEMVAALREFLTPKDEQFVLKQLEWYQDYYNGINEIYSDIYGVNLPKNIFYSPISREGAGKDVDVGLGEFMKEMPFRATAASSGGLKSRVRNIFPLATRNDTEVLMSHVSEMEHFKAWAHKIRDLNAVFSNPKVQQAIRINYGSSINVTIDNFIKDFGRGGAETAKNIKGWDGIRSRYTQAVLAAKPTIFLKQLTSSVAYADSIPAGFFGKEFAKIFIPAGQSKSTELKFFPELRDAIDTLFDSTLVKHRWEKGEIERDIKTAMNSDEFAKFRTKPSFINSLMFLIKLGDMGAIIAGGYPVYKYHFQRLQKEGMSQEQAHTEAIRLFESVTESTQQSSDLSEQSEWQRGGSFAKMFTMFKSSPNQYLRKEIGAIRNFSAGRIGGKQFLKTVMIYHFILPMFFQWVSDRFTWDEDEQLRAMTLGALNGYFILGDALDYMLRKALDMQTFDLGIPLWSAVEDMGKAIALLDPDDLDSESFFRAMRGLAGGVGAALGLPLKQIVDVSKGFSDTLSGEYEKGIAGLMGWSPFKAEKAAEEDLSETFN